MARKPNYSFERRERDRMKAEKKAKQAQTEKEKAQQEITERMARQRALRLAKEAADKEKEDDG